VPTPGKLSINKTAHQSHAAPQPTSAPPKPAWGAKPPTPVARQKKKSPWVAIGITVGALVVAAFAWFAIAAPYMQKQEEAKKKAEQAAAEAAAAQAKAAAEAAKAKAKPTWKLDLANVKFPERPATGRHHGVDFTVENTLFQAGSLVLVQTSGSPRQFVVSLPLKPGETILGKTYNVVSTDTNNLPRVVLGWKEEGAKVPGVQQFPKGYAMKLEFAGAPEDGKIPGKIYLSLPDPEQSFVAGTFVITPKTPVGAQPAALRPGPAGGGGASRPPKK
jgi:hypothetical protein